MSVLEAPTQRMRDLEFARDEARVQVAALQRRAEELTRERDRMREVLVSVYRQWSHHLDCGRSNCDDNEAGACMEHEGDGGCPDCTCGVGDLLAAVRWALVPPPAPLKRRCRGEYDNDPLGRCECCP